MAGKMQWSANPNSELRESGVIFALRNIAAHEEVTVAYGVGWHKAHRRTLTPRGSSPAERVLTRMTLRKTEVAVYHEAVGVQGGKAGKEVMVDYGGEVIQRGSMGELEGGHKYMKGIRSLKEGEWVYGEVVQVYFILLERRQADALETGGLRGLLRSSFHGIDFYPTCARCMPL